MTHNPQQPVAWRVKDFADGWILCHREAQARREAESAGNLIQPLYLAPETPKLAEGTTHERLAARQPAADAGQSPGRTP